MACIQITKQNIRVVIHNHEVRGSFPRLATRKINHLHNHRVGGFALNTGVWCKESGIMITARLF